jgi:hypothetical protein
MLMQKVMVKEKVGPWYDKEGVIVCVRINDRLISGHQEKQAKVRIGNRLTDWIPLCKLILI